MTATIPHQAIYRRWRAQTFREIVGQEAVVETLRNGVRTGRVAHAVLFVGPRGTGKTSLARILAKALNCTDLQDGDACDVCPSCVAIREGVTLDLVEIDAASNNGIESIRNLRERLPYPPGELRRKVYILDEAHQITAPAWNALLKSIEEPPEFVNFMFASTEPSKFPPAILSRLQRYDVRRLTVPEIEGKLERILAADGRTAEPEAIHLIARLAAGGMRDAESMLDQLLSAAPDAIDERRVRDLLGLADAEAVTAFVDALVTGNAAAGIALLDSLEERGRDARTLLDQVIDEIRAELVRSLSSGDATTTAGLADAARRLAAIDPDRAGVGGLRLQLELALFADAGPGATHAGTVAAPTRGASSAPVQRAVAITAEPPRRPDPAWPPQATSRVATPTDDDAPGAEPDARSAAEPVIPDPVRRARTEPAVASPPAAEPPPGVDTAPTAEAAPAVDAPPTTAELPAAIDAPPTAAELPAAIDAPPTAAELPAAIDAPPTAAEPAPAAEPVTATKPSAAPMPAVPTTASTADIPAGDDLASLLAAWPDIVARLSADPPTKPLITACRPVALDGAIVTLGFPEEQSFLKDAIERRRAKIEAGIGESLGRQVSVRCVVANIEVAPPPDPQSEGAFVMAEAQRILADIRVDVGEID